MVVISNKKQTKNENKTILQKLTIVTHKCLEKHE